MAIDREHDQVLQTAHNEQQNGTHESLPPADSQDLAQEAQGGVARQECERVSQERDALLDRLARLVTVEVHDEPVDQLLTSEVQALEPIAAQVLPQDLLLGGHLLAQLPGTLALHRIH